MPVIKTEVDDATYKNLVGKRKRLGLPSVSALFLKSCNEYDDQTEANEIVRVALSAAKKKASGDEFRLCDLFPQRWDKFAKGARLRAGKMFSDEIKAAIHGIRTSRKSSSNHQFYCRA